MISNMLARAVGVAILFVVASGASAISQDVSGVWLHESGTTKVKFARCGDVLCGHIVWVKSAANPAKPGQRVFYDMKPSGGKTWQGKAFDPESKRGYSGKMELSGSALKTSGCALGGIVCRSVTWSRSN